MGNCRVLSDAELQRIHLACQTSRDQLLVTLPERTGYLPGACVSLRMKDILDGDTIRRFLQIPSRHMRGQAIRPPIAVHIELQHSLNAMMAQRQAAQTNHPEWPLFLSRKSKTKIQALSRNQMWRDFDRLAEAAGVEGSVGLMSLYKVYTLRLYKESRYNVKFVQRNLGHREIRATFTLLGQIAEECQQRDIPLWLNNGLD